MVPLVTTVPWYWIPITGALVFVLALFIISIVISFSDWKRITRWPE